MDLTKDINLLFILIERGDLKKFTDYFLTEKIDCNLDAFVHTCIVKQSFEILKWFIKNGYFRLDSNMIVQMLYITRNWYKKEAFEYFYFYDANFSYDLFFKNFEGFEIYYFFVYCFAEFDFLFHTKYFRKKLADENFVTTYCSSIRSYIEKKKKIIENQVRFCERYLIKYVHHNSIKNCVAPFL